MRYVQRGGTLHCHDDVPYNIRQQLYAEEQQTKKRRRTDTAMTPVGMPPINITNVLPTRSEQATPPTTRIGPTATTPASWPSTKTRLNVPGLRDDALRKYTVGQQEQVHDKPLKDEIRKICELVLKDGLSLQLIHQDQNPGYFIEKNGIPGIARHFVNDIPIWLKLEKRD